MKIISHIVLELYCAQGIYGYMFNLLPPFWIIQNIKTNSYVRGHYASAYFSYVFNPHKNNLSRLFNLLGKTETYNRFFSLDSLAQSIHSYYFCIILELWYCTNWGNSKLSIKKLFQRIKISLPITPTSQCFYTKLIILTLELNFENSEFYKKIWLSLPSFNEFAQLSKHIWI